MNNGNVLYSLSIGADALRKITQDAYCFEFSDGRQANIPRSEMRGTQRGDIIQFSLPMWLINANDLHDYIDDEDYEQH